MLSAACINSSHISSLYNQLRGDGKSVPQARGVVVAHIVLNKLSPTRDSAVRLVLRFTR